MVEAMVTFTRTQNPDPAKKDHYETKYAKYKTVVEALDPLWPGLA